MPVWKWLEVFILDSWEFPLLVVIQNNTYHNVMHSVGMIMWSCYNPLSSWEPWNASLHHIISVSRNGHVIRLVRGADNLLLYCWIIKNNYSFVINSGSWPKTRLIATSLQFAFIMIRYERKERPRLQSPTKIIKNENGGQIFIIFGRGAYVNIHFGIFTNNIHLWKWCGVLWLIDN